MKRLVIGFCCGLWNVSFLDVHGGLLESPGWGLSGSMFRVHVRVCVLLLLGVGVPETPGRAGRLYERRLPGLPCRSVRC